MTAPARNRIVPTDTPSPADIDLERRIEESREELARTGSRQALARMTGLIGLRSPAQIERMERAKGLL